MMCYSGDILRPARKLKHPALVVVAEEVVAEVPVQPCLGRHHRLVPARI